MEPHHATADMHASGVLGAVPSSDCNHLIGAALGTRCRDAGIRVSRADLRGGDFVGLEHSVSPWHNRLEQRYRRNGRRVNK